MVLHYSLHAPRKGHADVKAFVADFGKAFADLNFLDAADRIAEGDSAFSDFLLGSLPAATAEKCT